MLDICSENAPRAWRRIVPNRSQPTSLHDVRAPRSLADMRKLLFLALTWLTLASTVYASDPVYGSWPGLGTDHLTDATRCLALVWTAAPEQAVNTKCTRTACYCTVVGDFVFSTYTLQAKSIGGEQAQLTTDGAPLGYMWYDVRPKAYQDSDVIGFYRFNDGSEYTCVLFRTVFGPTAAIVSGNTR